MIDAVIAASPFFSRVVGVCMGTDRIRPSMAINKEVDTRFAFGYAPLEFPETLHHLAGGRIDASPLLTGRVGLDDVGAAFGALGEAGTHAKILIDPRAARRPVSGL